MVELMFRKFLRTLGLVPVGLCLLVALPIVSEVLAEGALPGVSPASLPKDLSAWGMIRSADIVVKLVIFGLAFASLLTWTVAIAKGREVFGARQKLQHDLRALSGTSTLAAAVAALASAGQVGLLLQAAAHEVALTKNRADREGIKERIASRLGRIEARFNRTMSRGTGLLATIGATSPFVGLFGTVWGIMTSFIGISKLQTTNLAVVAPGIAEALLATAAGLVVAIPAVVIYNAFSRAIAANRALHADAAAEVLRIASRDLGQDIGLDEGAPAIARRARP